MPYNLQSAIAGPNACLKACVCEACLGQVVLTIGSSATEPYEPRQVRKEAAVNRLLCVPLGSLIRANYSGYTRKRLSRIGHGNILAAAYAVAFNFLSKAVGSIH